MEKISPKIVKDIEKSWFRSRSRDFGQFLEGFGIGFGEFGLGKKVSVLVSENLVSVKKSRYRYRKIWSRKKSFGIGLGIFGLGKKSRYWYRKNLSRIQSLGLGIGKKFGLVTQ